MVQKGSVFEPLWPVPLQLPLALSTNSTSPVAAQLPSAEQTRLAQSVACWQPTQLFWLLHTGVFWSVQSLFIMQPTHRPAGPQCGVVALRFRQAVSSTTAWQARQLRLAASQIGATSSLQLRTVRQPLVALSLVQLPKTTSRAPAKSSADKRRQPEVYDGFCWYSGMLISWHALASL
jgi:hypothetical protein